MTFMNGAPVGAHRLDLLQRNLLDRLGEELADEADRRDRQRENAGERAEADRLDEHDGDDHRVERAAQGDHRARRPRHPRRHQVARREQADRQRQHDAEGGREHRDLEAFGEALEQQFPAGKTGRKHAPEEIAPLSRPIMKRAHVKSRRAQA